MLDPRRLLVDHVPDRVFPMLGAISGHAVFPQDYRQTAVLPVNPCSRRQLIRDKINARCVRQDRGYVDHNGEPSLCKIWTGPNSGKPGRGRNGRGHSYGRMNLDGGTVAVHIASWIVDHGPIPPRKQLDQKCCQRDCLEDAHMQLVTHKRNQKLRDLRRKQKET